MNTNTNIPTVNADDIPQWTSYTIPSNAYIIMLNNETNPNAGDGSTIPVAYQLPLNMVAQTANQAGNTITVATTTADISVNVDAVVPAFVEKSSPYDVQRANANSASSLAQFLILKQDSNVDNAYIVQASGFYTFPGIHKYLVGQDYFLSDSIDGGVTTTPSTTNPQKLFTVISNTVIRITVGE